jgi:hypothetical protein
MKSYLSRSISSINKNKIRGTIAEIDLRNTLIDLGYANHISQGGWIARNVGPGSFGHYTNVFFPKIIEPEMEYADNDSFEEPPRGLHTICSTMHQIGIHSYYCVAKILENNNTDTIKWFATQLGIPTRDNYHSFPELINNYPPRIRKHSFLRYHTDTTLIPENFLAEEFTKEHLRISFQNKFFSETSDIDGIFWGQQYTYPIEIKEKTAGEDKKLGDYFGIDIGPFVKLAFYAAKRGNLHSLFIVREIDDMETRNLVNCWFITFDTLAQYASWVFRGGGKNMQGGQSSTIMIPKAEFQLLNEENLRLL